MASSRIAKGKSLKRTGSSSKLKDLPPPEAPQERKYKLEDFEMLSIIGTGTFGRVILVKDKCMKEYMALKVLTIADVVRLKQADHVLSEKSILMSIKHPFIVNLYWAYHNDTFLYMLLEYVCGGELFTYLRSMGRFKASIAKFFSLEITSAIDYLHKEDIVYRDLKPENILIDREGHVKLTDFGFAKRLKDRTWTLCGTPEYLAPEIIQSKGHGKAVDWWATGILIYEMLVGYPPFYDDNPFGIYEKILEGKIDWPQHLDKDARDLIQKLLVIDRTKRIGCMVNGSDDIKNHDWFKETDWDAVRRRQLKPPIVPTVTHDGDTQNFDKYDDDGWQSSKAVTADIQELFRDF
ncbi:cAMP-dependent protein kinase catalytic subunit PRKX-like [Acanthaster planci]|uniref:cAMP-dependent protein kinase catalytic subunit PRKX-like n=1 Tax=Acanthaster planci TaxID=133434 RepID=A0A8B7YUY3_ACAPL|nr:cAMP-dependent protein kinase catalytic subunit PRKX-like [Acanthaster planci]